MNNIFIFCGPDQCGKTEISKEISKIFNVPYYKASTEHSAFLKNQDRFINDIRFSCPARLDLLKQINSGIVYDRAYPCEWVYSRYFDRKTDDDAICYLDNEYSKLNAIIIFCTRKNFEGIQDDLDPSINSQSLEKISKLYDEFFKISKCRVLKLYVDDENLEREISDIIEFVGEK